MPTPRDLSHLAHRVERLQRPRCMDLDPSDELTFREHLPEGYPGRRRALPTPKALREMVAADVAAWDFRNWVSWVGRLEDAQHRSREPQRTMRDLARGRVNSRTLPFLMGARKPGR